MYVCNASGMYSKSCIYSVCTGCFFAPKVGFLELVHSLAVENTTSSTPLFSGYDRKIVAEKFLGILLLSS